MKWQQSREINLSIVQKVVADWYVAFLAQSMCILLSVCVCDLAWPNLVNSARLYIDKLQSLDNGVATSTGDQESDRDASQIPNKRLKTL